MMIAFVTDGAVLSVIYNPSIHHRRSIRLKGYDYSQEGLYYITICCQNWACLFGEIIVGASLVDAQTTDTQNIKDKGQGNNPTLILNDAGKMIEREWLALPGRFKNIQLHEYIIMPNHFHGILQIISNSVRASLVDAPFVDASLVDAPFVDAPLVDALDVDAPIAQNDNELDNDKGRPQGHAPSTNKTVGDMMDAFKSITTVEYIRGVKNMGWKPFNGKFWQRDYYEHIIRNEKSYQNISKYIIDNPSKWKKDKFF